MTSIWGINGCKGHISIISVSYQYHISIISLSYQYHISIISVSYQHMGNPAGGTMRFTSPWDAARFYGYGSRLNTSKMGDDDESAIQPPQKKITTDVHPKCNKQWIIAFPTFSQVCWFRYPQLGGNGRLSHSAWGCSVARSRCWRHCAKSTELD